MCVKPDGTLSLSAEIILKVCDKPATIDEMAQATSLRSFRIKSSIRELTAAGLLEEQGGRFRLTQKGKALLTG
ncbi:MAG: winged helix-turn-helix domain-containing protein [Deltaproteobacteria bacterium]|jgi:predicted transcriptional regulator